MQVSFVEFGCDALPLSDGAVPGRSVRIDGMQRGKESESKLYIILEVIGSLRT